MASVLSASPQLQALQPVLATALDAVVVMHADGTVADWNGRAETVFGWQRSEAVGRPLADLIVPPQHREAHRQGLQRYLATGKARLLGQCIETTALHRDGREFPIELSVTALPDQDRPLFLAFLRDISERKWVEEARAEREAYLTAVIKQTTAGVAQCDAHGRFLLVNDRFCDMLGRSREALLLLRMQDVTHADDLPANMSLYRRTVETGEPFQIEKRYVRPDGSVVWVNNSVTRIQLRPGAPVMILAVGVDITARKQVEELQQLLIRELHHRVKNGLAIVQSIAYHSFKGPGIPLEAKTAFDGRLAALATAHNLLTQDHREAASIRQIIEIAIAPFGTNPPRFEIDGPDLRLPPRAAVGLALTLHELGTNAAKYGALSSAEGRVELRWRIEHDRLMLVWRERGGPAVSPPTQRGFGTRLIERSLATDLGGAVVIDFQPSGVVCSVDVPLPGTA